MIRAALALLGVALFSGCATPSTRRITVPMVPAWIFASGSEVFTDMQLFNGVFKEITAAPNIETTDSSFITIDHAWLESLCDWAWDFQTSVGIKFVAESFDCDKFALGFAFAANVAAQREGITHQPLLFRIRVEQNSAFGGVAAGGAHALVAALTNKGFYVVEPQTRKIVPFSEYPNKNAVFRVRIGG